MKEKITYLKIVLAIAFCFVCGVAYSQSNVTVQLRQPPPFQFKAEDLWKVTLTNPGNALNVYLFGTVSKGSQKMVDATTAVFNLPKGVKLVKANEIGPIDVNKYSEEAENTLNHTGTFPSGVYNICVYVYAAGTNQPLGSFCGDYEIINLTKSELLSPLNEETVRDFIPNFNWLPPNPVPPGRRIAYEIKFTEILERQTAYYSMQANPIWFSQKNIATTLFSYPLAARPFSTNRRYAWMVNTYIDGTLLSSSEIWEFTYENVSQNVKTVNKDFYDKYKKDTTRIKKLSYENENGNENKNGNLTHIEKSEYSSSMLLASSEPVFNIYKRENAEKVSFEKSEDESWFKFSGSYNIDYSHTDLKPVGSELPTNIGSFKFDPTISIYNIPFSLNLYFDTQQDKMKQNINSFAFLFKPSMLTDYIKEQKDKAIKKIRDKVENDVNKTKEEKEKEIANAKPNISGWLNFFSYFKTLGLGETYPVYSPYTLNGVKVTGVDVEFNPGIFYLAGSILKNLDAVPDNTFSRKLWAGRIGVGAKDESHFHFTFMKAWDDENSVNLLNSTSAPQENILVGTSGKLTLFQNRFEIEGEFVGSMLTRDKLAADLVLEDFPAFFNKLLTPKISSTFDFMYEIKSKIDIPESDSKLEFSYKSVGPGFTSLGAPNIRQDINAIKFNLSQSLFKKQVIAKVSFQRDKNNLSGWNSNSTTFLKMGFNLKFNFRNYPYLVLDFRPASMTNDAVADSMKIDNNASVITIMTGYTSSGSNLINSANLYFSNQMSKSSMGTNDYTISNIFLSDNLSLVKIPVNFSASIGYTRNKAFNATNSFTGDFSLGINFFEVWNNSIGFNYTEEEKFNNRKAIYFSSMTPITKYIDLNFYAEKSFYRESIIQYGNIDDFRVRTTLSKSW
jgi:hypothetical protein